MNKNEALKILGFAFDANPSEQEINKAFKKKAAKVHPDVNKSETAEAEFKQLNNAQDLLKNPPENKPMSSVNYEQKISDFFSTGPRIRFSIPPINKTINLTFKEAVLGCEQTIKIDKMSSCDACACKTCEGRGVIEHTISQGSFMFMQSYSCNNCKGLGRESTGCSICMGNGIIPRTSEMSIKIPGGILNGNAIKLRGCGNVENNNGILHAGDVILNFNVEQDKDMRIQGIDVISTIDIPLLDALKGSTIKVKTVLGETSLSIKRNAKHKDTIILNKYGVEKTGNHIFVINVLYPNDTDKLIKFLEEK